jgi:hypothetical protein
MDTSSSSMNNPSLRSSQTPSETFICHGVKRSFATHPLKVKWREALIISFSANAASVLVGWLW